MKLSLFWVIAAFAPSLIQCVPNYWSYGWNNAWQDLPFCSNDPVPCDMALKMYASKSRNSPEIYSTDREICTCPHGNTCPSGWSTRGEKTITRDILSKGKRIGIALHYCNPIGGERTCGDDEVAMVMEGGNIPEKIRNVNCKCPSDDPLKIKKSYYVGWKKNHDLVCAMPQCNINRSDGGKCQQVQRVKDPVTWLVYYVVTNLCECPSGYDCVQEDRQNLFYGYCQRINA
ncbi:uncharacterized protein LOC134262798 [Saccostrea cucullata]|uniref:uncharacterized protein LOC134262798 n=1 Tax=Saccostrea cuccullata TaxID=36930 RepID=UPI002ED225CD